LRKFRLGRKREFSTKKIGGYIDTGRFQRNYRLIAQIEGAAGSIMDNIAEAFERSGNKAFLQFLYIAKGSCGELRSQLYRALDRACVQKEEFDELFALSKEIIVMLQKLIAYLETSELKGVKYKNQLVNS
jgi:four helix bundle protein